MQVTTHVLTTEIDTASSPLRLIEARSASPHRPAYWRVECVECLRYQAAGGTDDYETARAYVASGIKVDHARACPRRGVAIETPAERVAREQSEALDRAATEAGFAGRSRYDGRCGRCAASVVAGRGGWRRENGRVVVYCLDRDYCDARLAELEAKRTVERRAKIERDLEAKRIQAAREADEQAQRAAIAATHARLPAQVAAAIAGTETDATAARGALLEPYAEDAIDREVVTDRAGQTVTVPVYATRPGESLLEAARRVGGRCATRTERWDASAVIAIVTEDRRPVGISTSNSAVVVIGLYPRE